MSFSMCYDKGEVLTFDQKRHLLNVNRKHGYRLQTNYCR